MIPLDSQNLPTKPMFFDESTLGFNVGLFSIPCLITTIDLLVYFDISFFTLVLVDDKMARNKIIYNVIKYTMCCIDYLNIRIKYFQYKNERNKNSIMIIN